MFVKTAPQKDFVQHYLQDDAYNKNREQTGDQCVEHGNFTKHDWVLLGCRPAIRPK